MTRRERIRRIVIAAAGGWNSPSARYRLGPVARAGRWNVTALSAPSLPRGERIEHLLEQADRTTVLILQRVMPGNDDLERLRNAYAGLVFDMDDAIYAVPPVAHMTVAEVAKRAARLVVRGSTRSSARRKPLIETLELVDLAIVGNEILGAFADRYASRVIEIPTTVEPVSEPPEIASAPTSPTIVWMGLPDNMGHLDRLSRPLSRLCDEGFALRVVSSDPWRDAPVEFEFVPWSEGRLVWRCSHRR